MNVADGIFQLEGTESQKAILADCFFPMSPNYIDFPWHELRDRPSQPITLGWMDLNAAMREGETRSPISARLDAGPLGVPGHVHIEDGGHEGHAILRRRNKGRGRWFTAGVFWTDGRIYIDTRCQAEPALAREVLAAELAHAVDYFLPLTGEQKDLITAVLHPHVEDEHTWWERHDYGAEYYDLIGETFMAAFTYAYSDIEPWQDAFTHKVTPEQAAEIAEIVGYVVEEPVEPYEPEPVPTVEPAEEPDEPEPYVPGQSDVRTADRVVAAAGVAAAAGGVIGFIVGYAAGG